MQTITAMLAHETLGTQLEAPSILARGSTLYMTGALEASFACNLGKSLSELLGATLEEEGCCTIMVTDKKVKEALKVRLLVETMQVDP